MRFPFPRAALPALMLAAVTILVAGCVGPTDADTCFAPQGEMHYLLVTQDGAERDVPATDETRWSLRITCSEERRPVQELSLHVETVDHGTLIAAADEGLPDNGRLTLYALAAGDDPNATAQFSTEVPAPGSGPAYRLRITDDSRSREHLDERDLIELRYDADGRRDFQSELPIGTYRLVIHDRADDTVLGDVSKRFFDPRIERGEDTSGGPPPPGGAASRHDG